MCNFDLREIVEENLNKERKSWNFPVIVFFTSIICSILYLICTILKLPIYFWKKFIYHNIFIDKNNSQLVLIEGPWGIGKTYVFNKYIKTVLKYVYRKNIIYTSLFGVKDKQEIKNKIIDQYIDNKYSIVGKFFLIIGIAFPTIYSLLCFFNPKLLYNMNYSFYFQDIHLFYFTYNTFKCITFISILYDLLLIFKICPLNYLIKILDNKYLGTGFSLQNAELTHLFNNKKDVFVFDDLERISDNADIKEILGFLNELRDVYQFNVIVIANEEELEKRKNNKINITTNKGDNKVYETKDNDVEYKYFREKFNPAKFEIEYREEILNNLIQKEPNKDVKYLIEKIVKPLSSKKNTENTTSNLRIIKRFIEIISDTYKYAKKDNVISIEEITRDNISEILNYSPDNIFILRKGFGNINFVKATPEEVLFNHFKNYITKIYILKSKYHNNESLDFKKPQYAGIETTDIADIYKSDIENSFFMSKIELLINIYDHYPQLIKSIDLFLSKIKECKKIINLKILSDLISRTKLYEKDESWFKNCFFDQLKNYNIKNIINIYKDFCSISKYNNNDKKCNYVEEYVYNNIEKFLKTEQSVDLAIFLFSISLIVNKYPDIILKILELDRPFSVLDFITVSENYRHCLNCLDTPEKVTIFKNSIKKLYKILPVEKQQQYKNTDVFKNDPELLD